MRELRLLGLEEFAAGRGVEEEVAKSNGGADGETGVFDPEDVAAGDLDQSACRLFGDSGLQGEAGDAGDRRESFAAKAECGDGEQVVGGAKLGGGVALEGQERVVANHSVTVITDADELAATSLDLDANACRAGIKRVFKELFDDGGGPFDDFTSGDLVRHQVREDANAAHVAIVVGSGLRVAATTSESYLR